MKEILQLSALEIAKKIKAKEVTPSQVLESHIEQIESVNRKLNAVVEKRYDQARELAAEYDKTLSTKPSEELPALFGVPFTVKEMMAWSGAKRTAGSIHRRTHVMDFDSTVLTRLKKAGAIAMATTNVPELGFWYECSNPVYGVTNNPYDLERTSGGSSGGEASIIGAGASVFGIGSDIGGSIRMPAAFCGVAGHKPSNRLTPLTGHFPYYNEHLARLKGGLYPYTSVGPIARRASDLRVLTEIMMGPDGIDPETKTFQLSKDKIDFDNLTVLVCPRPLFHMTTETEDEVALGVEQAAKYFEQLGAKIEMLDPRLLKQGFELWSCALRSTKEKTFGETLSPEEPINLPKEFFQVLTGKGRYTVPSLVTTYLEQFVASGDVQVQLLNQLETLRLKMEDKLKGNAILLFPVHPRVAPKHGSPLFRPFDFIYTGIFNVLGTPATSVPIGLNTEGLPLSVQVVSAWGQDHLCLQAAEVLESAFGGWTPSNIL